MRPVRSLAIDARPALRLGLFAAAAAALLALSARPAHPAETVAKGQSYPLTTAKIAIYNLAGTVTIEPTTEPVARVEVTTSGADAARLRVVTGPIGSRQTLRVIYPGDRVVYPALHREHRTQIQVRNDGTFGGDSGTWASGRKVTIAGSGGGVEAHADLRVFVPKGTNLDMKLAVGDVTASRTDGKLLIDVASADVHTSATKGDLAVDAGSGEVETSDAVGPVSIDTGSGRVRVTGVRGGPVNIDTGSGDVEGTNLDITALNVDTGSGGVELSAVKAKDLHIDTGSGTVEVDLVSDVESLEIDTGSGEVEVRVPANIGAMVWLETGSGGVSVDLPVTDLRKGHGELQGQLGDGRGRISIETGSGGISILKR